MSRNKEKHRGYESSEKAPKEPGHKGEPAAKVAGGAESGPAAGTSLATLPAGDTPATAIEKLQDQLLRLRADFDNFRKRTLREKTDIYDVATSEFMLELLPVLDHLQLGIQAAVVHQADKAIQEGLQLIFDQLMGVLTKFGLEPFDTDQQPFDPARCEAVSRMASDKEPEGTVLAQTRRGYMLRNKLLRPAQVVVSSGPSPEPSGTQPTESGPCPGAPAATEE